MKCHSDYIRSRLISCVCTINETLFTSSGKHFTQLKYKMLEIFFLIPVNSKFVIQCTQIPVDVEVYYLCQQHPQLSIERASGFLPKVADHYEMSGFLLVLQDGNQSQRLEQVIQLAQFTASLPEVFAFIYQHQSLSSCKASSSMLNQELKIK